MADERDAKTTAPAPAFSDTDKARALQWFKKARECLEKREYDYGIECYLTGLGFWPEAVEEGHKPLRALAMARLQTGGKAAGMMEKMKKSTSSKDFKQNVLNAEWLWSKDPLNGGYLDPLLKSAVKAAYLETAKWIAPILLDNFLKKDKKPDMGRFKAFRQTLEEAAERAEGLSNTSLAAWFYEQAVASLDFLAVRNPGDEALRTEQRNLSSKLTISRGKYSAEGETFRGSLKDGDQQKILHDADRMKQGDQTMEDVLAAARREYEANPTTPVKINGLVDVLLRRERENEENEAVAVLRKAHADTKNYNFKVKADDVRLRQAVRRARQLVEKARGGGTDEDKQAARKAVTEQLELELEICRERCEQYPTDLRMKFRLGAALFKAHRYDETIPILQVAQGDPKNRARCQLLIGRCFYEKQTYSQAIEVLKESLDAHQISGDDLHKELLYWMGRACEADGRKEDAAAAYGKLLRVDYNYADGDARKRLEGLK